MLFNCTLLPNKHRCSSLERIFREKSYIKSCIQCELAMISAFDLTVYELLNDIDINIQRLRWLGIVARMEEDAPARLVFDAGICKSRRGGRPCIRWKDQIKEAL